MGGDRQLQGAIEVNGRNGPSDDLRELTATMTATTATSPDHRRTAAAVHAVVTRPYLDVCHT